MNRKVKLFHKFLNNPCSLVFSEIEKLLLEFGFESRWAKSSHKKFFHKDAGILFSIPVHYKDCKDVYKRKMSKIIKNDFLTSQYYVEKKYVLYKDKE